MELKKIPIKIIGIGRIYNTIDLSIIQLKAESAVESIRPVAKEVGPGFPENFTWFMTLFDL